MNVPIKTMEEVWQGYRRIVMSPEAGEIQVTQTKQAFFAGVMVMLDVCQLIGSEGVPESVGVRIISMINDEMQAYRDSLNNTPRKTT